MQLIGDPVAALPVHGREQGSVVSDVIIRQDRDLIEDIVRGVHCSANGIGGQDV